MPDCFRARVTALSTSARCRSSSWLICTHFTFNAFSSFSATKRFAKVDLPLPGRPTSITNKGAALAFAFRSAETGPRGTETTDEEEEVEEAETDDDEEEETESELRSSADCSDRRFQRTSA